MRNRHSIVPSMLVTLGLIVGIAPADAQIATQVTAFEGMRLITGDGATIENATLIVDGATIVQAGKSAEVRVPSDAKRVNLAGKTVMPAIIDTHVHTNQSREALTKDLQRLAYFGVGTALSLGVDTGEAPFEIAAQPLPGATRLLTAGRGITAPEPGRETAPYWVTNEAEARKAVSDNVVRKVDMIKIWVDDRQGKYQKLAPELYRAVIDEAHRHSLLVTAHIVKLEDAKSLIRAGVDAFAHSVRDRDVDDDFLVLLHQRPGFVLNPNLTSRGVPANLEWLKRIVPPDHFTKLQKRNQESTEAQSLFAIQARNLKKMIAEGASVVLGTDTSFDFADGNTPWAAHIEMEDMVAAGMTPTQVIAAASRNAAAFLKLTDAGSLAVGKRADFIVLDANPLDDITNTRRIATVYLRGVPVDRDHYVQ